MFAVCVASGSVRRVFVINKFSNSGFLENLRSPSLGYERPREKNRDILRPGQTRTRVVNGACYYGARSQRVLGAANDREVLYCHQWPFPTSVLRFAGRRSTSGRGSAISRTIPLDINPTAAPRTSTVSCRLSVITAVNVFV